MRSRLKYSESCPSWESWCVGVNSGNCDRYFPIVRISPEFGQFDRTCRVFQRQTRRATISCGEVKSFFLPRGNRAISQCRKTPRVLKGDRVEFRARERIYLLMARRREKSIQSPAYVFHATDTSPLFRHVREFYSSNATGRKKKNAFAAPRFHQLFAGIFFCAHTSARATSAHGFRASVFIIIPCRWKSNGIALFSERRSTRAIPPVLTIPILRCSLSHYSFCAALPNNLPPPLPSSVSPIAPLRRTTKVSEEIIEYAT